MNLLLDSLERMGFAPRWVQHNPIYPDVCTPRASPIFVNLGIESLTWKSILILWTFLRQYHSCIFAWRTKDRQESFEDAKSRVFCSCTVFKVEEGCEVVYFSFRWYVVTSCFSDCKTLVILSFDEVCIPLNDMIMNTLMRIFRSFYAYLSTLSPIPSIFSLHYPAPWKPNLTQVPCLTLPCFPPLLYSVPNS